MPPGWTALTCPFLPTPGRMLTGVRAGGWLQAVRGLGNSCLAGPAPPCPPSMCVLPGPQGRPLSEHNTAPLFHQVFIPLSHLRNPDMGVARPRGAQVGVEPGTPAPQPSLPSVSLRPPAAGLKAQSLCLTPQLCVSLKSRGCLGPRGLGPSEGWAWGLTGEGASVSALSLPTHPPFLFGALPPPARGLWAEWRWTDCAHCMPVWAACSW